MKTVDFSETIAASDLKVDRCRQGALSVWAVYAQFSEAQGIVLKLPVLL